MPDATRSEPAGGHRFALLVLLLTVASLRAGAQPASGGPPAWWYNGPPGVEDAWSGPFEVNLQLGLGSVPLGDSASGAVADITPGILLDQLLNRIFIYRRIHDRLTLDFDYNASREGNGVLAGENFYALDYAGAPGETVRRAALGNRIVTIPGDRYVDASAPPGTSIAAVVDAGTEPARGTLAVRGIARIGGSDRVTLHYVGSRRVVEAAVLDIDHVRRRHFFLPDTGVDPSSLSLFVSTDREGELYLDGRSFRRLQSPADFTFDAARSWIHLAVPLSLEVLIVTYTVAGVRVGDPALGRDAFINESGVRQDCSATTLPGQFGETDGVRYLYLNRPEENSYWEHRGVYIVPELREVSDAGTVRTEVVLTATGEPNTNYADVTASAILDTEEGLVFFAPDDDAGFYPRPFPGVFPYTHPTTPGNPFDPTNPVYGDVNRPEDDESVNTLWFRFSTKGGGFVIEDLFVPGSVTVTVDGEDLPEGRFTVDASTGVVTIASGIVSPETPVTIAYRRAGDQDAAERLFGAVSADWDWNGLSLHTMVAADTELPGVDPVMLGQEQRTSATASASARYRLGSSERTQLSLDVHGAARAANPNSRGVALIAGMDDGATHRLSLEEGAWQLASASDLLPAAPVPVSLAVRGKLHYENFYDGAIVGGGLKTLSWDNTGNAQFTYAQKAGPYNTADAPSGGAPPSLVLDYRFDALLDGQYVTVSAPLAGDIDLYDAMEITLRGDAVEGTPVHLYIEILSSYREDLDGDGELDGEQSIDDPGFVITPSGGTSTVIGSGRTGGSNGTLESEDRNGNGVLDPVGAAGESGVIVSGTAGEFAVEIAPDSLAWETVRLDLRSLAAAEPAILESAEAIRLTIVPSAAPAGPGAGRVLINSIAFHASRVTVSGDDRLSLRTITPATSDELAANLLPTEGGDEEVLEVTLEPPLPEGSRTAVARWLGGPVDLTRYREIVAYLYAADPAALPTNLGLDLRFVSVPGNYLGVGIAQLGLAPGWNEVRVATGGTMVVSVNGVPVGELAGTGAYAALDAVSWMELGLSAVGGEVTEPVVLWTDEWFATGSIPALGAAAGLSLEMAHHGDLLVAGTLPIISDADLRASYDYEGPEFAASGSDGRHAAHAETSATLFRFMPLGVTGGFSSPSPRTGDGSLNLGGTLGLDTGIAGAPVVEHAFRYGSTRTQGLVFSDLDYLPSLDRATEASIRLSEDSEYPTGWEHHLSATRTVSGDVRRIERDGALSVDSSTATLTDSATAQASAHGSQEGGWNAGLLAEASRSFLGDQVEALSSPDRAWVGLVSGVFAPVAATLAGARPVGTAESASAWFRPPDDAAAGVNISVDGNLAERNFNPGGTVRDVSAGATVWAGLPLAFGPDATVRLTPSVERGFTTSVSRADAALSEWSVLGMSMFPGARLPLAWATPFSPAGRVREREALSDLRTRLLPFGGPDLTLATELGAEARLAHQLWYLPSVLGVSARGTTRLGEAGVAQQGTAGGEMSNSAPIIRAGRGAGSLVVDASGSFSRDYLLDTRAVDASLAVYFAFSSITGRGWQVNHTSSWSRVRQDISAPGLMIYPDHPALEPYPPEKTDTDRITMNTSFLYTWRADRVPSASPSTLSRRLGVESDALEVTNRERVDVRTSVEIADPAALGTSVQLPFRLTLGHYSEITQSEHLSLHLSLEGQGGVEKQVNAGHVDLVPGFGIEFSLGATIRY